MIGLSNGDQFLGSILSYDLRIVNRFYKTVLRDRAISTGVAHFLHTEGVTGSNPVSPINYIDKWLVKVQIKDGTQRN